MLGLIRWEFRHCPGQWRGYEKGGSSSSSASTSNVQETIQMDNRMVNDGGSAVSATNSTVTQNVTNNSLDGQAALAAMSAVQDSANSAIAAANASAAAATAQANKAIETANQSVSSAFQFAGQTAKGVFDFGETSSGLAYKTIAEALGFAKETLSLGAGFVRENKDLIGQTQSAVSDAYKTAQQVQNGQQVLVIAGLVVAGVVAVQALK